MHTYPGVYVEELPSQPPPEIAGAATSIAVFVGWTVKGPTNAARRVASLTEFEQAYGRLDMRSVLGYSVKHFFENGGRDAFVVRLASSTKGSVLSPNTLGFDGHFPKDCEGGVFKRLDALDEFNLLAVPGETSPAVIAVLQAYCRKRRAFLIADGPEDATVEAVRGGPDPRITGPDASNSALYFPWLLAADPLQAGAQRRFPSSGFVAGLYARIDESRGVWKAPAGTEATVLGASGVAIPVTDGQIGELNARGINGIRSFPDGIRVWGARTLKGADGAASDWKYVNVRRLLLFLETSIEKGLQWTVFEPNDESLWALVRKSVENFLIKQWRSGAFQGTKAAEAFFVRCDRSTMTRDDIDNRRLIVEVGVAPVKPAEFIVFRIVQKDQQA